MNKSLFYLSICSLSFLLVLTGCDEEQSSQIASSSQSNNNQNNNLNVDSLSSDTFDEEVQSLSYLPVTIINSYLFHNEPELLPNHKLIKQQKIEGTSDKLINYNEQGYVANYDLEGFYGELDYKNAKYFYGTKENRNDYKITFDASKNILGMKNSKGDIVARNEFDEDGRLVEMTLSHFAENNVIFNSKIVYDQYDRVELVLYSAYVPVDNKVNFPILLQEKTLVYSNINQLEKSITKTFKLSSSGEIIVNDKNEQEVEINETCSYSDYTVYSDWTKAVCVTTGDESKTTNLIRTIDYQ